jgi:hypothetical protein
MLGDGFVIVGAIIQASAFSVPQIIVGRIVCVSGPKSHILFLAAYRYDTGYRNWGNTRIPGCNYIELTFKNSLFLARFLLIW